MTNDLFGDNGGPRAVAALFYRGNEVGPDEDDLKGFSVRTSASRLAYLDVMAENAGVSRNRMVNELLRVGMDAVLGELPDVIRGDIETQWLAAGYEENRES